MLQLIVHIFLFLVRLTVLARVTDTFRLPILVAKVVRPCAEQAFLQAQLRQCCRHGH